MSDGDRGEPFDPRLKRAIKIAAAIAALLVILALVQQARYYQTAAANAADYAENARDHIGQSCLPLAPAAERQCAQIANDSARQNQRGEYDLYSQKSMALWTGIMGGMAIVGVGLSVIGVYLIWQTWGQTKEAATASRKAAQTARDTLSHMQTVSNQELRPWLAIVNVRFKYLRAMFDPSEGINERTGLRVNLLCSVKNFGKMQAEQLHLQCHFFDGMNPSEEPESSSSQNHDMVLPGDEQELVIIIDDSIRRVMNGRTLAVCIHVRYNGVGGQEIGRWAHETVQHWTLGTEFMQGGIALVNEQYLATHSVVECASRLDGTKKMT